MELTNMPKDIRVNRPEPIVSDIEVVPYKRRMNPQKAIKDILDGSYILIEDYYSTGLTILHELNYYLKKNGKNMLDNTLFQQFIPECTGLTIDPQRESLLIRNKKTRVLGGNGLDC